MADTNSTPTPRGRKPRKRQRYEENFWLRSYGGAPVWMIATVLLLAAAVGVLYVMTRGS